MKSKHIGLAAAVGVFLVLMVFSGTGSAVSITITDLEASTPRGENMDFDLTIGISGERIPIDYIELEFEGTLSFSYTFYPSGSERTRPPWLSIMVTPKVSGDYSYGSRWGYDVQYGYGYDFGYGYGYGGTLQYNIVLDSLSLALGSYSVTPHVYTGSSIHPKFSSQDSYVFEVVNNPPAITTADVVSATEDSLYSVNYEADNPDSDTLTWSLDTSAEEWLDINPSTGSLIGTPDNSHVGSYWVKVTVDDGNGGTDSHNFTLTVYNVPPAITTGDIITATEDTPYSNDYASDDDGQGTVIWLLESNGSWLSLHPTTGVLSGTPDNSHVGNVWVNVTVHDGNGGIDSSNFSLT
ncbi:MAG: putative Ig domain-containing protein, partial [Thermoplasmata archaeon]